MTALARATKAFQARGAGARLARQLAAESLANDRLPTLRQREAGARRILRKLREGRR